MSVLGLDVGNANCVIAVAQRGGVDILANEASNRSTPTLVAFGEKQRFVGEGAYTQQLTNLKNTIGSIKILLGQRWSDPSFQKIIPCLGSNKFVEMPGDGVGVEVTFKGEVRRFTPEQLLATLLVKLKEITEKETSVRVADVVVSVPSHFNVFQRTAVLDATKIARLNALRIVNDHTAASVNYGLYKIDITDDQPRLVMIIDVGDHVFKVSVTEFTKSRAKILCSVSELGFGGSGIDLAVANHFADLFFQQYNVDLRLHPKSWFRLLSSVVRVKKVLNANPSAPLNIECIYEEYDINALLTREEYEKIIQPFLQNISTFLQLALDRASLKVQDIYSIELIGGASRTHPIQRAISSFLGRELSFTMNAEESIARGCALQCAILSPKFRVREYGLVDIIGPCIEISWHTLDDPQKIEKSVEVFPAYSHFPSPKWVNFTRPQSKPFVITIRYKDPSVVYSPVIGRVEVAQIPIPESRGDAEVRVKIRMDLNGVIKVEAAELVEKYEEKVVTNTAQSTSMNAEPAPEVAQAEVPSTAACPADAIPEGVEKVPDITPTLAEPEKKTFKVRRTAIPFKVEWTAGLTDAQLKEFQLVEEQILQDTALVLGAIETKNALESYVYDSRDKLNSLWRSYVTDEDYLQTEKILEETQDWLYNEGEDVSKDVYETRLMQLHSLCDPISNRVLDYENAPVAISRYRDVSDSYKQKVVTPLEEYAHIPSEEKSKLLDYINQCDVWLDNLVQRQKAIPFTENPVLLYKDVLSKIDSIVSFATPILSKPKPVVEQKPAPDSAQPQVKENMETDEVKADLDLEDKSPLPDVEGVSQHAVVPDCDAPELGMDCE